jgi:hypothetical protein
MILVPTLSAGESDPTLRSIESLGKARPFWF